MAALVSEWRSYQDIDGKPIVNGFVYVGVSKSDTKANPVDIFSNRELTTPIANPQRTDSYGKTVNKIWTGGKYSLLVTDENDVQILSDPDVGNDTGGGSIIVLENVQGSNEITATGIPSITSYTDKTFYIFTAVGINTLPMTLDIDTIGPLPLVKDHDKPMGIGNIEENQIVMAVFNEIDQAFEVISHIANDGQNEITIWSGALADIPAGKVVCDGNNGTPDLRNQFIRGADGITYMPGVTGGSETTGSHTLTIPQIPSHTHSYSQGYSVDLDSGPDTRVHSRYRGATTGSTGGGQGHTHPGNVPPFIYLIFIMKS